MTANLDQASDLDPAVAARAGEPFDLGPWRVEPASGEIRRGDEVVRLEPKVMAVLLELARHPGLLVSRDDLFETVWGSGYYSQDVLWRSISILRSALGDDPQQSRFIQTLSRRGYRLVAEVRPVAVESPAEPPPHRTLGGRRLATAVGLLLAVSAGVWMVQLPLGKAPGSGSAIASGSSAVNGPAGAAAEAHRLGLTYFQRADRADLERAIALFERAVELDPGYAPAFASLAEAYLAKSERYAQDLELRDRAEELAERALALDPRLASGHASVGSVAASRGHLVAAIAAYRRAVALDPELAAALNALGLAYLTRGELGPAQTWLRRAEEAGFDRLTVLNNLGELSYLAGDGRRARELWRQALELDPRDPMALGNLAILEVIEGRPAMAEGLARHALTAHPTSVRPLNVAGYVAIASGREAEASRLFGYSLGLSAPGRNGGAALAVAHLRWRAGEVSSSLEMLDHGVGWADYYLERGDERWHAPLFLAKAHAIRGDGSEAERWLRAAVDRGYLDHAWAARHPTFSAVAAEPWFRAALGEMQQRAWYQARGLER